MEFVKRRVIGGMAVKFVNAPHEVCLARRIHRDVRERGRTE
jgi:uridine kinase